MNDNLSGTNLDVSQGERSSTPLNFDDWNGDVNLTERELKAIDIAALEDDVAGEEETDCANNSTWNDDLSSRNGKNKRRNSGETPAVSRRKKKPKGMPKRPLSAYNIFFQQERVRVLEESEQRQVSFEDLGKMIGKRWKTLAEEERKEFEQLAQEDSGRYRKEMETFHEMKKKSESKADSAHKSSPRTDTTSDSPPSSSTIQYSNPPEIRPLHSLFPLQIIHPGLQPPESQTFNNRNSNLPPVYAPQFSASQPRSQSEQYRHPSNAFWQSSQQSAPPLQTGYYEPSESFDETTENSFRSTQQQQYPIPPGTEVILPDPASGRDQKYRVEYKFYKMTKKDAEIYMQNLSAGTVPFYGAQQSQSTPLNSQQIPQHFYHKHLAEESSDTSDNGVNPMLPPKHHHPVVLQPSQLQPPALQYATSGETTMPAGPSALRD